MTVTAAADGAGRAGEATAGAAADELAACTLRVVVWLRRHPDVVSGPSVRALIAFTDVAVAWCRLTGGDGLLQPALVSLPHRLQVAAGSDADELVRQAVEAVEHGMDEDPREATPPPLEQHEVETAGGRGDREGISAGRPPQRRSLILPPGGAVRDDEIDRVVRDLVADVDLRLPDPGPVPAPPGLRGNGEERLAALPRRRGDRSRDLSVRATVRAAMRHGSLDHTSLRTARRRPTVRHDVVLALDVSASMGEGGRQVAADACTAVARTLARQGHRVGIVAFADAALVARGLTRAAAIVDSWHDAYERVQPTNIEAALLLGRRVLREQGRRSTPKHLVVLTDAEPTTHAGVRRREVHDMHEWRRVLGGGHGYGVHGARRAALLAALACRREDVVVSVLYPCVGSDTRFATALAAAGGGRARPLPGAPA